MKNLSALLILIMFHVCPLLSFGQGNLIDSSIWTSGTGDIGVFKQFGTDANTLRETNTDPYGNETLTWKALGPVSSSGQSGGWISDLIPITDKTKSFRFTVWVMKKGILDINGTGNTLFGFKAPFPSGSGLAVKNIDGSQPSNGHFFYDKLPELDKWYLLVGFIHGENHSSQTIEGNVYDAATGLPTIPMQNEFKFGSNTSGISSYYALYGEYYSTASQLQWNPSIYETTDPQMPSIEDLLTPSINAANAINGSSVWSSVTGGIEYNNGNVAIGTAVENDYPLAVNGAIHAKEVKVDLAFPAPDYVFYKDYDLLSLEEIQLYINKHGHLPNIPSAKEIESKGIELGIMNMKLLEKIEELTLYILKQEQKLQKQEQRITNLEIQNKNY